MQFIGESMLHAAIAALVALALIEWLLPLFNMLTGSNVVAHYPTLVATLVMVTLLVGVLAGSYPAFVLAAFRPTIVLKGGRTRTSGSVLRQALVLLQFAMLIGLLCAIVVIFQQTRLAMELSARLNTDGVVAIRNGCERPSFVEAVRAIPGVASVACSESTPFNWTQRQSFGELRPGVKVAVTRSLVDFGFFELYRIRPLAGRLFSREHGSDAFAPSPTLLAPAASVINQTASRRLLFSSPHEAVGQFLNLTSQGTHSEIVGVVPDFPISGIREPVEPTVYAVRTDAMKLLSVKLRGGNEGKTLRAIDAAWEKYGKPQPADRFGVEERRRFLYASLTSQGRVFGVAAVIAATLACLGMFGLASFMAERRTREVGIRKAMGAERGDILRLLMWSLTRPVLLANLVAWPVTWLVMRRWLDSFAYRVDLEIWTFAAASAAALLIAWLTVVAQAVRVARAKPVAVLRYE